MFKRNVRVALELVLNIAMLPVTIVGIVLGALMLLVMWIQFGRESVKETILLVWCDIKNRYNYFVQWIKTGKVEW